jgi:hypothetical protein
MSETTDALEQMTPDEQDATDADARCSFCGTQSGPRGCRCDDDDEQPEDPREDTP